MVAGGLCVVIRFPMFKLSLHERNINTRENDSKGEMCKIFRIPKHQPKKAMWVLTLSLPTQCGVSSTWRRSVHEMMGVGTCRSCSLQRQSLN